MNIHVTIESQSPADIAKLAQALNVLAGGTTTNISVTVDGPKVAEAAAPKKQTAAEKKKAETRPDIDEKDLPSAPPPEQESAEDLKDDDLNFDEGATEIKDEELRAACQAKGAEVGREKVKALVDASGYTNVNKIPKAERAAFLAKLNALA